MQLSELQLDTLTELINIGVGRAAGVLNQMTQFPVKLQVPAITLLRPQQLAKESGLNDDDPFASVQLNFKGLFSGNAALVFPTNSAVKLVSILTGESPASDIDEITVGTLNEVGNIVLNGIMGSISNVLEQGLKYSLPSYSEQALIELYDIDHLKPESIILIGKTQFSVEEIHIEGEILLIFELGSFDALINAIDNILAANA